MNLSPEDQGQLLRDVAVLVKDMDRVFARLDEQDTILDDLKSKADQGKGILWVLLGLGSAFTLIIANAKNILHFFAR
jgi:hypothetical protein